MNGHSAPRRIPARPPHATFLPAFLVLALIVLLTAATLFAAGCGSADSTTTTAAAATTVTTAAQPAEGTFPVTVTDDNGNSVTVKARPTRIVSTAPANTETLFALGVGDRVVGVNSLDDYPPEVKNLPKVGDFQANTEAIMALSPDLVVGYSGNEEALAPVQAAGAPVLIMNPTTLDGIYSNITTIGAATGATGAAAALVEQIKTDIKAIADKHAQLTDTPSVFYAVDNTLWTCGPGSFVDELLSLLHVKNVADANTGGAAHAYYQFSPEQLLAADPSVILLPGSVYNSADEFTKDPRFAGLSAVKNGKVFVIDDIIVTRPGPRIAEGLEVLAKAIRPGTV
jgi:iron complex transport system substrate-binding protein